MKRTKSKIKLPRSIQRMFPDVKIVSDAKESVQISVNHRDCKVAQRLNPTECALAKAAKRELHVDKVIIGLSTSYLIKDNEAIRFATPEAVQREIVSFDRHQDFAPGDYYLRPKAPTNKMGMNNHYKAKNGGNHKPTRKIHHSARVRVVKDAKD